MESDDVKTPTRALITSLSVLSSGDGQRRLFTHVGGGGGGGGLKGTVKRSGGGGSSRARTRSSLYERAMHPPRHDGLVSSRLVDVDLSHLQTKGRPLDRANRRILDRVPWSVRCWCGTATDKRAPAIRLDR